MHIFRIMVLGIFSLFMLATTSMAEVNPEKLNLGVFPRRNPIMTTRMFTPLVQYLTEKLGVEVVLDTPNDFESFWEKVKNKEYDIVHYNQYHYVKSHKEFGYQVIAKNVEFNEDTIAGALIVRKDSNITTVKDLKGKKIVFGGGPRAMQSYIVARYLLQENGLYEGDYEESFASNPPNAIMSAYFKQSAAAGAGDKVLILEIVKSQIDINDMKYLARGEQLAHLPWAVKNRLNKETVSELKHLLINLDESETGKRILKKLNLNGLGKAEDKDYDPHRKIINAVLNEEY